MTIENKCRIPSEMIDSAIESINAKLDPEVVNEYRSRMRKVIKATKDNVGTKTKGFDYHNVGGNILGWISVGCPWFDMGGGCSVCDGYGKDEALDQFNPCYEENLNRVIDEALDFFRKDAKEKFKSGADKYTVNLGSATTLHDKSLPKSARARLFAGVNEILMPFVEAGKEAYYLFETRIPDITDEKLAEMREYIDGRIRVDIGVGIESASDFVREAVLNKGYGPNAIGQLKKAVEKTKEYNATIEAHSLLGIPGLTELESIANAVETAKAAIDAGVHQVILMTTNIKEGNYFGGRAYRDGDFELPSLHATAEVMRQLNSQGYYNALPLGFVCSDPTEKFAEGCGSCDEKLRTSFDTYARVSNQRGAEAAAKYLKTADMDCECEEQWMEGIKNDHTQPNLSERFPEFLRRQEERYLAE
jgi:radical SAM enzyme (TIGR01210 family)